MAADNWHRQQLLQGRVRLCWVSPAEGGLGQ
jgi:hypothetical protein